jgi:hypothetical protein
MRRTLSLRASSIRTLCAALTAVTFALGALPSSAEEGEAEEEVERHRHLVAGFLGAGIRDEHGVVDSGFVLGLGYEYRIVELLGAGAIVEVAAGNLRDVVLLVPFVLHPWRELGLVAAPGVEFENPGETRFAMRLGVTYEFPLGSRFRLIPEFNADIVDGDPTFVFGLSFGLPF